MKEITQKTQYHPDSLIGIRRKRSIISPIYDGRGFGKKGEPQAILRVRRVVWRTMPRACLEGFREARRYCMNHLSFVIHLSFDILILTLVLFISCCGYSTRSLLPDYIRKVHIKLFENRTLKVRLDEIATDAVLEAFRSGSNLQIVDEKSADIVISGKVVDFSKDPYTYTSDQTVLEYRITVKFSVRCLDMARNEIFWEGSVSDWATYETDEDRAIEEATKKTAERLVNAILTSW